MDANETLSVLAAQVEQLSKNQVALTKHVMRCGQLTTTQGFVYAEEAVAAEFGVSVEEAFYGLSPVGRPIRRGDTANNLPRRVLYNLCHHLFGYSTGYIQQHYRCSKKPVLFAVHQWLPLHESPLWDELSEEEQEHYHRSITGIRDRMRQDRQAARQLIDRYKRLERYLTSVVLEEGLLDELVYVDTPVENPKLKNPVRPLHYRYAS